MRSETLSGMKWLLVGIVLGVLGVRLFDAITEHEPAVRPPPLELSEDSAAAPAPNPASVRKLPMRIRVDAIEAENRTLITQRKDGVAVRSAITDRTEFRNGFAEAGFGDIRAGDMVNGSRVKRGDAAYEVLTITRIEPPHDAPDRQAAANLPERPTEESQSLSAAGEPRD